MLNAVVTSCFSVPMVLGVTWLALVQWLQWRLRNKHPAAYIAIGSPRFFECHTLRSTARVNWLMLKYLWCGDWQESGDCYLASVIRIMQTVFVIYLPLFAVLMILSAIFGPIR